MRKINLNSNSKKKIAVVGTTLRSIIQFRKEFIEHLKNNGHTVLVFYSEADSDSSIFLKHNKIESKKYTLGRTGLNPFKDLISIYQLVKAFKAFQPDIVFSFFSKPSIYGTIAARICGVSRIVAMLEGLGYTFIETKQLQFKRVIVKQIQILLYAISFRFLDLLILLNEDDFNDLVKKRNLSVKQTEIFGGIGVDLNWYKYSPPSTSPVSFIFIGRLLNAKGIHEFCLAAKALLKTYPTLVFNVIGTTDPANPDSIKNNEIVEYHKIKNLNFIGHVNDVRPWIEKSSVFVLPSYREGFPRSTQEAMAMGRAVITVNTPGCRQSIHNNQNGYIVASRSSKAIIEKMESFILDPTKITKMGKLSREISEQHYDIIKKNNRLAELILGYS